MNGYWLVACRASFCPFFHISVPVQKSTQNRTIRQFIIEILTESVSASPWRSIFVRDLEVFGFMSREWLF